jgi:hypothetical protein
VQFNSFFFYGYNPIVVRKFNAKWSRLLLGYDHFKQIYLFTWMVTASSFFCSFFLKSINITILKLMMMMMGVGVLGVQISQ